jgi:hypothetical protein
VARPASGGLLVAGAGFLFITLATYDRHLPFIS